VSKRARRPSVERLHPRAREWLLTGYDWDYLCPDLGPHGLAGFESEADAREAWFAHRDELLAEWLEREPRRSGADTRGGPGTRPWGWWRFEANVPRHVTAGGAARQPELRALGWGTEEAWRAFYGRPWGSYLDVESERAYLSRHRLFLEGEEAALRGPQGPQAVD